MNTKEIKELYGWNETLEKYSISTTPQLKKEFPGSFRVKKHKGKYFWYYRLSNDVKGRDKYLCSVEPNDLEPNQTSFEYAVGILMEKLRSKFVMGIRNKSYLHTYIIPFKEFIDEDKYLTSSVKSGRRNTIDRFGSWSKNEGVRLNIVPTNEMKNVFLKFIKFLENNGLQKSSIKAQLQIVRYFLNWLCEDKLLDGAELFPSHPISLNLQNELLKKHIKTIPRETKSFKNSYYTEGYEMCSKKIQTIWQGYCENLGRLDRIRDKNGKINQPPHMIGRDIVYFISYLQIRMGFRLSEVFYSYRNRDVYNDFHIPNYPNEMASYWEKSEDGWIIHIKKSKNKDRSVPFIDTIRSWVIPPSEEILKVSKCVLDKKGNPLYWDTPFIDVCMELFPNSYYLFPSPNQKNHSNSKRSKTYYMNEFKVEMVLKNGWDKLGINSSHDLRRFFISHSITNDKLSPFKISQITGHNINTMEKFYIRDNMKEKFNHFKTITQSDLLNMKPSRKKD
tara:strand:- start:39 stop:1550 length:1512 start_codon:yes stop_codon:yes gene_type:complete